MRSARHLTFCLWLAAVPVLGAGTKIHVDYDSDTTFSDYTTFQFRHTRKDLRRVSPSLHQDVARQIIAYARGGGLALVPSDPDIYLAYYAACQGALRLAPEDLDYAYGDGFAPGSSWERGVGTHDLGKRSFTFKQGTVVIDVWDRERGVLVWRGVATGALKKDYDKNRARLGKALERVMRRWEETYGVWAGAVRKPEAERQR